MTEQQMLELVRSYTRANRWEVEPVVDDEVLVITSF
jgi:hypothetical protein